MDDSTFFLGKKLVLQTFPIAAQESKPLFFTPALSHPKHISRNAGYCPEVTNGILSNRGPLYAGHRTPPKKAPDICYSLGNHKIKTNRYDIRSLLFSFFRQGWVEGGIEGVGVGGGRGLKLTSSPRGEG